MMNNHGFKHPWVQLRFHTEVQEAVGSCCSDLYSQMHLDWNYNSTVRRRLEAFGQLEWTDIRLWKHRTNTAQDPFSYCVFQLTALSLSEPDGAVCLLYPLKWVDSLLEKNILITTGKLLQYPGEIMVICFHLIKARHWSLLGLTVRCIDTETIFHLHMDWIVLWQISVFSHSVYSLLYCISCFVTITEFTTEAFWWLFREAVVAYIMWIRWFLGMN